MVEEVNGVIDAKGSHPGFLKSIVDIIRAHLWKGADYGTVEDTFANLRSAEEFGVAAWKAAILKANDKMSRIKTFFVNGELRNESVEDSLLDLANYAAIALTLYREHMAALVPKQAPPTESESGHEVSDK